MLCRNGRPELGFVRPEHATKAFFRPARLLFWFQATINRCSDRFLPAPLLYSMGYQRSTIIFRGVKIKF